MNRALRLAPALGAGLLWGAFVPAAVFSAVMLAPYFMPLAVGITIAHALVLGLPVALLFMWRRWTRLVHALLGGFVIGLAPLAVFSWPPDIENFWISAAMALGYGALGAIGAATCWFVLRTCGALSPDGPTSLRASAILAATGLCADVGSFVFL